MSSETQSAIADDSTFEFPQLCQRIRELFIQRHPDQETVSIETPSAVLQVVLLMITDQQSTIETLGRLHAHADQTLYRLAAENAQLRRELEQARDIPCG